MSDAFTGSLETRATLPGETAPVSKKKKEEPAYRILGNIDSTAGCA